MPPQPGVFALPYASTHKSHTTPNDPDFSFHPLSRSYGSIDDGRKERKRKDFTGKLGKEIRDYSETLTSLVNTAHQLSTDPSAVPLYNLRFYPLSLERSALLAQFSVEEKHALEAVNLAYEEERERIEEEWRKGHERIRERLLEGIEERRRRSREEKEGEGFTSEAALDVQSRPHITRKLRNKLNTSPPSTPLSTPAANPNGSNPLLGAGTHPHLAFLPMHPHSLSIDELPSPFPLSLTHAGVGNAASGALSGSGPPGSKRRVKTAGGLQTGQGGVGGLGRSLSMLAGAKENEVESDLGEIRRGNKRRRAVVGQNKHG